MPRYDDYEGYGEHDDDEYDDYEDYDEYDDIPQSKPSKLSAVSGPSNCTTVVPTVQNCDQYTVQAAKRKPVPQASVAPGKGGMRSLLALAICIHAVYKGPMRYISTPPA